MINKAHGSMLLKLARSAIEEAFSRKSVFVPTHLRKQNAFLQQPGMFVTLLKKGELRGSMGYPEATYPLIDAVIKAARDAAFNDPRFKAVTRNELPKLRIRINILSKFTAAKAASIKPGNGACIEYGPFRAMLLPEDSKQFKWTGREIVQNTLRKAGLAPEMWKGRNVRIYTFTTQRFEEKQLN